MEVETRPSLFSRLREAQDEAAWREFSARYRELILAYCRASGLQMSDAEDVCQLVMIGLTRSLPRFEYDPLRGRFRDYLGKVVRRAVRRFRGGSWRRSVVDGLTEESQDPREPERDEEWEHQWMQHHFRTALRALGGILDGKSIAVFERLVDGAEPPRVAAEFGMSCDAVQKVRQRVREQLRRQISAQLGEEE